MNTYMCSNLQISDVMEAIEAMDGDTNSEKPFDLEDSLLCWFNNISRIFNNSIPEDQQQDESPEISDLWIGLSDGMMIAKAIIAYRPELLRKNNTFFNDVSSYLCQQKPNRYFQSKTVKERIYNWQRILQCCDKLNVLSSFSATIVAHAEDPLFKTNLLVFIVELFCALVYEEEYEDEDGYSDEDEQPTRRDNRASV
jgi:hypothetical protein